MEAAVAAWGGQAAVLGTVGRGGRYPRAMRVEAARLCREVQTSGGSVVGLAGQLGVAVSTLWSWASRNRGAREGRLVAVRVEAPCAEVRLRLGAGEALVTVEQLAELVRRLSC